MTCRFAAAMKVAEDDGILDVNEVVHVVPAEWQTFATAPIAESCASEFWIGGDDENPDGEALKVRERAMYEGTLTDNDIDQWSRNIYQYAKTFHEEARNITIVIVKDRRNVDNHTKATVANALGVDEAAFNGWGATRSGSYIIYEGCNYPCSNKI